MKIAYIALRGVPLSDGIVMYTDKLASELTKRGHDVTVYTSRHYGNCTGDYHGKYKIKVVPSLKKNAFEKMSLIFFASFAQIFKNYDIVHFHSIGIFSFTTFLFNKKVVIQSHGIEYERAKWGNFAKKVLYWIEKNSYNKGDALIVVSKALKDYYKKQYNKDAIYIPTAVNLPDLSVLDNHYLKKYGIEKGKYYLFMARIVQEKGAHYLIKAFKQIKTDKKLVIAGTIDKSNVYHKQLLEMAKDDSRILFLGNISGNEKDNILKGAYAFCQPSEIEGLSVALLEAMSYEKCCIVSDIPMNTEAVDECGIIFKNKDVGELLSVLKYAEENSDIVEKKGKDSRKRIKENYTWDIVASQMEDLYKGLVNND